MANPCPQNEDPAYITYLLDSERDHDCYFLVGNPKVGKPERIGATKMMLFAHSEVLRREWSSDDIPVEDLYPDTFKNLLRYVYGYDQTSSALSFEDADNLLYAAEKYQIEGLKRKLVTRLISLLTPDNICSLLNNPVCFTDLQLDNAITEILQYETKSVLASPHFLSLNPEALLKILKQGSLNVTEIKVWRSILKWAKHKVGSEDRHMLRSVLKEHVMHIRFCALKPPQFIKEVVPTSVLDDAEVKLVYESMLLEEKQNSLTEVCNEIEPRKRSSRDKVLCKTLYTNRISHICSGSIRCQMEKKITFDILTYECGIDLMAFKYHGNTMSELKPVGIKYECDHIITFIKITDYINRTSTDPPLTSTRQLQIEYDDDIFVVPATVHDKPIHLLPNNVYRFNIEFSKDHCMSLINKELLGNEDFQISLVTKTNMVGLRYKLHK